MHLFKPHNDSYTSGDSDNDGLQEIILGQGGFGGTEPSIRRLEYNPLVAQGTVNNKWYSEQQKTITELKTKIAELEKDKTAAG